MTSPIEQALADRARKVAGRIRGSLPVQGVRWPYGDHSPHLIMSGVRLAIEDLGKAIGTVATEFGAPAGEVDGNPRTLIKAFEEILEVYGWGIDKNGGVFARERTWKWPAVPEMPSQLLEAFEIEAQKLCPPSPPVAEPARDLIDQMKLTLRQNPWTAWPAMAIILIVFVATAVNQIGGALKVMGWSK